MPKTLIIALKINCLDEGFQDYLKLSGIEKLNLIERRLKDVCEQLNISNPNDKWILAWREHGLSTICTPELKKEFKNRMLKLTKSYPHLTIIGGTMLSVKKAPLAKAKEILKYYDHSLWLEKIEEQESKSEVRFHREKVAKLAMMKPDPDCKIDIVRNTCYIFEGDSVRRFDKMAPFSEMGFDKEYSIFKPGGKKGRNMEHFFTLAAGPDDYKLNISLEICREHAIGWVKHVKSSAQKVSIHFILSSFTPTILSNIVGDYLVHLDSLEDPKIIKLKDDKEVKQEVLLHTNNLLENHSQLSVVKPDASFKTILFCEIHSLLESIPSGSLQYVLLNKLKDRVSKKIISDEYYLDKVAYSYFHEEINNINVICNNISLADKKTDSQAVFQKLSKILNNRYITSQFIENDQMTIMLSKKIISHLKDYITSQSGLFSAIFFNNAFIGEKIKLARNLIKCLEKTASVKAALQLILEFQEQSLVCNKKYNQVFHIFKDDFQTCLDSIEEELVPNAGSNLEDHIVKIA